MLTVEKMLTIPKLKGLQVVAGHSGLKRRVGHVTVMEVPDIIRWLKGDDFLVTSLYAVKDDKEAQCSLFYKLAASPCACIGVKVGQYVTELDARLLQIAEETALPLLLIPYDLTYIEIIVSVMNHLFEKEHPRVVLEKYIKDVVFEAYTDAAAMAERGKFLGVLPTRCYMAVHIGLKNGVLSTPVEEEALWQRGVALARYAACREGLYHCIALRSARNCAVMLDADNPAAIMAALPYIERELEAQFAPYLAAERVCVGYGPPLHGLDGMKHTYFAAVRAVGAGQVLFPARCSYKYSNMQAYCTLLDAVASSGGDYFDTLVKRIGSRELLETLLVYFENDCCIEETAAKLFAHKNTIKYRLRRIKELTGLEVGSFHGSLQLFMAIVAYKVHNKNDFVW